MDHQSRAWLDSIAQFARDHGLWTPQHGLVVAFSGGPDSVALACFAQHLLAQGQIKSARLIHINHNHREGLEVDEKFALDFARRRGLELDIFVLDGLSAGMPNFEARARKLRHGVLQAQLREGELLLSGHHLDDAFEWWLAQSLKSSSSTGLGIPLVNGHWRRPFLSVTKGQIFEFLKREGESYLTDPTGLDVQLERNYLRTHVIPALHRRYPQRLRHFSRRMNQRALELGVHVWSGLEEELGLSIQQDHLGGVLVEANSWEPWATPMIAYQVGQVVRELSTSDRGVLAMEIEKTCRAVAHAKKGPMSLSGGVQAYLFPKALYLVHKTNLPQYAEFERTLMIALEKDSQIPDGAAGLCLVTPYFLKHSKGTSSGFKTSLFPQLMQQWPVDARGLVYAYQAQRMFLDSCSADR
jgi:tRNA(Ile)-lysidine synthase